MEKPNIMSSLEAEDVEIINAFFCGQPLLLQSTDMNNDDLNTIKSHIKYNILDISQSNVNHGNGILTVDQPTSEEMELKSLLSEWNFEVLADEFIAQNIFVDVLKIVKRHQIERLLKGFDLGMQLKFEDKLEKWRESIGIPLSPVYQDFRSKSSSSISSTHGSNTKTPTRFMPYQRSTPSPDNSCIGMMLSNVLNETSRGKGLVDYYDKFLNFHEDQRTVLISLIAHYYKDKGMKMYLATSYQLEKQILERFPSEKLEYYRTLKRGKLYNKFYNLIKSFKRVSKPMGHSAEKKSSVNTDKISSNLKNFEPENEESCIKSLKFDNLSSFEFDCKWKACCNSRTQYIKSNTIEDVMEKWPFYKQPSGYRLIDMDFETSFTSHGTLFEKWEACCNDIISFLSKENHIKDINVKKIIETLLTEVSISENGRHAALIWALHGYFVPTNKIVRIDPKSSKKVTIKPSIKDSQESVIFVGETQQNIEDYMDHVRKIKTSIQPSLFCVGEDIFSITDIFLFFDGVRYNFKSILEALDICFKTIYLFDIQFPKESIMFYTFLECFFYNFKSTKTYSKVHMLLEYLQMNSH